MKLPIFLDVNIPIYAVGAPHPLKAPCAQIILLVSRQPQRFVTSVEVVQELTHYYLSRRRWEQGRKACREFATLMAQRIEPIYAADVRQAAAFADQYSGAGLSARDLLHVAVMTRLGVDAIISADRGFDAVASLMRYDPLDYATWQATIGHDESGDTDV